MSRSTAFHIAHEGPQGVDIGPLHGAVVAIGNFDGVHRGHRAVIGAARARAKALGRKAAALTFTPHPRLFLRPQDALFQLSSDRDRLRLLAASRLDGAIVMNFNAQLAATSAADFIERILVGRFGIGGAAIGFDFHFGHNRQGSPVYLSEEGARLGFAVDIVPPLEDEGRPVSSGAVRAALSQGKMVEAAELLGAPWFVSGEVIHGDKRGRDLGFPTANLKLDASCGLKHGVDAVLEAAGGVELEIGGRKAEIAAALVAVDYFAGDEPGCAEQLGRFHHLALAQRRAHRARRHRPAFVFERRYDIDGKAEPGALLAQIDWRALAVMAEMEIETDGRAADAEAPDQNVLDKISGGGGGKLGVEIHHDGAIEPARRQQPQPVAVARQLEQRVLRPQEQPRMRREGQSRGLAPERLGACASGADHSAMAAVHAVEIADRHNGAMQRADIDALRAFVRDMEGCRSAHFCIMFASCAVTGPDTVSARLTNFQINRIFKACRYIPASFRGSPVRAWHYGCRCFDTDSDRR